MNRTVIYNGNPNDLFLAELMDKVQVKSIITGELVAMEWLGDHEGPTEDECYDFGTTADCSIDVEIFKDRIKLFSGAGLDVIFDPGTKHFSFLASDWNCKKGTVAQQVFPEIYLPRPKTMRAFTISVNAFIAHIYNTGTSALESLHLRSYEMANHWPYSAVEDPDLPF